MRTLGCVIFLGESSCHRVSWVRTIAFVQAHSTDDSSDHVRCYCKDWPRDYSVENVPMAETQRKLPFMRSTLSTQEYAISQDCPT